MHVTVAFDNLHYILAAWSIYTVQSLPNTYTMHVRQLNGAGYAYAYCFGCSHMLFVAV